ncbi:tetratricopeptide repeat protein [Clostridium sp. AL.422]|uniref:tetratricopeptide repeat protein n=1 Tax=Clostridium TaxID=1485 RepID=UPI00293DCCFA|nr:MULTISPECIES: tetratricopeptide repeat protein [unclassified Clostridium]MDV4150684.1 tetratricopeptide repeat protein [Clostridium sp. AL.422]
MGDKFNFLLLEFKDIYYILSKIWEEEDLKVVSSKIIKLIKEIIITAHLNNKIFYNTENSLEENIEVLSDRKILPYDLMRYITNYLEEVHYIKKILNNKIRDEKKLDYEDLLKNEDFIYEVCVWLAIKCGEEDYSLFINKLSDFEKRLFNKYIDYSFDDEADEDENGLLNSFGINDLEDYNDEYLEKEEISAEENLLSGELYYLGKNVEKDYYKAKSYFEKAAKEGNEHAASYLGLFFEKGYGGEKDIDKSLYWYKKAALKGNIFAQYSLGFIYYEGELVEKNLDCAFKWYKEAAEKGFAPAQYALSYLYKNGEGCEQNNFKAYYWLEESADNDFEDAYYILGQSYLEGNNIDTDYKKAFHYLSKGLSKNDKHCLESLGDMYYWGLYVEEDKEKAFSLYDKSIEEGNASLYYKIGKLHEENENFEEALLNYYKGHGNGDVKCTQRLGVMYLDGKGVNSDKVKGFEYIKTAAESGDSHSLYIMGLLFLNENREKAQEYLIEAYRKGSYHAAGVLAGEGIKDYLNNKEIKEVDILGYINKAIENGLPIGTYYYGLLNYYGISLDKNNEMAFINFLDAAERGCDEAIVLIANWYKHGIFLAQDINEAIAWYEKAAEGINIKAISSLIEIYEKGIGGKENHLKAFEGALVLRNIDIVQGDIKLAYYYYKGIGVEVSVDMANKYIDELLTLDQGKAYNFLGELCEEGLLYEEDKAIEYYLKAISFGEPEGYSNLEYYLYKKGRSISEYSLTDVEISARNGKRMYVLGMSKIREGRKDTNITLINEGIRLLKESLYSGIYESIDDLVRFYEEDKTIEGLINSYKYKEKKLFYNI